MVGVLAPARTSPAIIGELNSQIGEIVNRSEMQQWLRRQGFEPASGSPAKFAQFIKDEIVKWGKIVRALKLRVN